jgi:hypothetical protein
MAHALSDGEEDVGQASTDVNVPLSGAQADESFSVELQDGSQQQRGDQSNNSQTEWEVEVTSPPTFDYTWPE